MPAFTTIGAGFRVAPGRYAVVATDWSGEMPDPRPTIEYPMALPFGDTAAIVQYDGLDVLLLPMGTDDDGCTGRSIAVGDQSLVCFGHVAIVALDDAQRRSYPYASHLELVAAVDAEDGRISFHGGSYEVFGFNRDFDLLDACTPGMFAIEATDFDMGDPGIAEIFGYGSPEFVAALDEHGFYLDVAALRARLAGRTDTDAVRVLNMLPSCDSTIAYYAPVAP